MSTETIKRFPTPENLFQPEGVIMDRMPVSRLRAWLADESDKWQRGELIATGCANLQLSETFTLTPDEIKDRRLQLLLSDVEGRAADGDEDAKALLRKFHEAA